MSKSECLFFKYLFISPIFTPSLLSFDSRHSIISDLISSRGVMEVSSCSALLSDNEMFSSFNSSFVLPYNKSRYLNWSQQLIRAFDVFDSPIPMVNFPSCFNLEINLEKSLSLETIQNASTLFLYKISMAFITNAISDEFLPLVV